MKNILERISLIFLFFVLLFNFIGLSITEKFKQMKTI